MSFWQARTKVDAADRMMSQFVRERAGNKCERCGADGRLKRLDASHFHGRRMETTRFDPENVDCLCAFPCHAEWESEKAEGLAYYVWKRDRLGAARFDALTVRAHTPGKKDRKLALLQVKAMLAELRKGQPKVVGAQKK